MQQIMQTPSENQITLTDRDLERLQLMLDLYDSPAAESLDAELGRACVVPQGDVSPSVATMNSVVVYEDCHSKSQRTVRLVYPKDANAAEGRVSVLVPIGSALLGLKVGQEIDWKVPTGVKRIRVVAVEYQPEAAGDLHL